MPNPYGAPEISATESDELLKSEKVWILDVREEQEFQLARNDHPRVVELPLSRLANEGAEIVPENLSAQNQRIVVMCHHGVRSAQVTVWLMNQGWKDVVSMEGGIAAYAQDVDAAVGTY